MNNKGEIIIHIGPPKTATTSLQYYFQHESNNKIKYLGVEQPRSERRGSLADTLYKSILKNDFSKKDIFHTELKKYLDNGDKVFISEEMLLVDSKEVSWQTKLRRLYSMTADLEPKILITIRNPVQVIPSYYQEIYYSIDKNDVKSLNEFTESNYCTIFKYESLIRYLKSIGFENLVLFNFDELINSDYSISDLFEIEENKTINIRKKNFSPKNSSIRYAKKSTLKNVIGQNIGTLKKTKYLNKIFKISILKKIYKNIPNITFKRGKKINQELDQELLTDFSNEYRSILDTHYFNNIN